MTDGLRAGCESGGGQGAETGMDRGAFPPGSIGILGSFRLGKPSKVIQVNVSTAKATTDTSPSATSTHREGDSTTALGLTTLL